jgi:hypothetical protein
MHKMPASAEPSVPPPIKRRPVVVAALLLILLFPPAYLVGWWALEVASSRSFGALGTKFARWRYADCFNSQYAELLSCLEQSLSSSAGAEAVAAAEDCFAQAELRFQAPFAIHVLAPTVAGSVEWQEVRSIDNSFELMNLHAKGWSEGLHLYTPTRLLGRCLLYVRMLPTEGDQPGRCQAYSVLVPIGWLHRAIPPRAPR